MLAGIDNDADCRETYEANNKGSKFICADLEKYKPKNLAKDAAIKKNDDNLIFIGCAPCQYWSIIRTDKTKSEKSKDLIINFRQFVTHFKPGIVVVENVPGLARSPDSNLAAFINYLEETGYKISADVLDFSNYGVPQKRKRYTLIASRVGEISLPQPVETDVNVEDWIGPNNGFAPVDAGHRDKTPFDHSVCNLSDKNKIRLLKTPLSGGSRDSWQKYKELELPCYVGKDDCFRDVYGRMNWKKPAPTITTKFFKISNGRFAHPNETRGMSIREGATLQTFPRNYTFISKNVETKARMIGNAVPPAFATHLGRHIVNSI